jgi:hypothetical protein
MSSFVRFGLIGSFLLLIVTPLESFATIDFLDVPLSNQFFQRNSNDQCAIDFTGNSTYEIVRVKCYKRIGYATTYTLDQTVNYTVSGGNFAGSFYIDSELIEWEFRIYGVTGGVEYFVQTASNIVCGETFVVCGQSNAIGGMSLPVSECDVTGDKYARAFGPRLELDTGAPGPFSSGPSLSGWNNASPEWLATSFSGGWGMSIQKQIITQLGIPVGVINVAVGATEISQHFANSADIPHGQTYNIWEGMMARLEAAGILNSVKTIFWYQGEGDTDGATCQTDYYNLFMSLYDDWHNALPDLEQIYLFQLNTTCNIGENNAVNSKRIIRDSQLRISEMLDDVQLITTFGVVSSDIESDQCHYLKSGQCKMGAIAAPMYAQFVNHTVNTSSDIYPPRLLKAVAGSNTIVLTFDKNISVVDPNTSDGVTINQAFYDGDGALLNVSSSSVSGATITLTVSGTLPSEITYLPNSTYNGGPNTNLYYGPWIMNVGGTVAASSYFNFPVISSLLAGAGWQYDHNTEYQASMSACSFNFSTYDHKVKQSITVGCTGYTNSVPASSSVWFRVADYANINGTFTVPVGSEFVITRGFVCP